MKEWKTGDEFAIGATEQVFKVKIGTGTASIQMQADDEGFDEITDGAFSATGFGVIKLTNSRLKVVLTGDARFFIGIANNRT